ncbi:MAG: MarR family transcriptional regulator [Butyrivibrio sp.]|jgi:DNA-binding MarR family transcriptional regulator|nr:MarR family transcriptional regulator [Butyrivibrio sp.]
MLNKVLSDIYSKLRVSFYMKIFANFENREATLTMVEAFSMECIMALDEPTVAEFARMMNISAPNAAYRVGQLVQKGYIEKIQSKTDQREYHLRPTQKFINYFNINTSYIDTICERCKDKFSEEDYNKLVELLSVIDDELMPELHLERFKSR